MTQIQQNSVFLLRSILHRYNWLKPTESPEIDNTSGTAFYIEHKKFGSVIVTNAHCVMFAKKCTIYKLDSDVGYNARVILIGIDYDMALLHVDDPDFFKELTPLVFTDTTKGKKIYILGYPGPTIRNLNITAGYIGSMGNELYGKSCQGIAWTTDCAVNSGNSGGPAFDKLGNVVGIAFSSANQTVWRNINFIIPTPVILSFIRATMLVTIGKTPVRMPTLSWLGSILMMVGDFESSIYGITKQGVVMGKNPYSIPVHDVLLEINGHPVSRQGNMLLTSIIDYEFPEIAGINIGSDLISIPSYIGLIPAGTNVELKLRSLKKKARIVNIKIKAYEYKFDGFEFDDEDYFGPPRLLFIGDYVFSLVTHDVLHAFYGVLQNHFFAILILMYVGDSEKQDGLILSVLGSVNGVTVKNFSHLVEISKTLHNNKVNVFQFLNITNRLLINGDTVRADTENAKKKFHYVD